MDESHRNRNKGRKVPLDWLVDVIPVPSDMVPRVVQQMGRECLLTEFWKVYSKLLFTTSFIAVILQRQINSSRQTWLADSAVYPQSENLNSIYRFLSGC